jgi:mediator of RNA polymerase II transcription subunit 14
LPPRLWAGAIPTVLPVKAFDDICKSTSVPNIAASNAVISPIHRFLGCVFMRRQLQHIIKSEDFLTQISTNEQGVIAFRVESSLVCRVSINQENCFQSLHLKIMPDDQNYWQSEHTLVLQKFFDEKVSFDLSS